MKRLFFTSFLGFLILIPAFLVAQSGRKKVAEGNKLFKEKKFDEAINKYQDALLENPTSPLIQFNIGDVLYKKKNYKKALDAYHKSLNSDDPLLQSQMYYNIGNTLYRMGKLPESILAYQQALKLNPDDQDAKYNLEFVRNKLKENAKPQQQNQQQQRQQQKQQQQQQQNRDQKNNKQKQQQKKEEQKQQGQNKQKKQMTKEEAKRLLEALKENQKKLRNKQIQGQGRIRVEKDW